MPLDPSTGYSAASILQSAATFLSGALTALFAEPIRQRLFRPKLVLSFDNDEECVSRTFLSSLTLAVAGPKAIYIRVRVNNARNGMARECRGYLIGIEERNEKGEFVKTEYCDSIMLHWSCQRDETKYLPIHIPRGVNQFLDVVALQENKKDFIPQIHVVPNRYRSLFHRTGVFRFTIQVVADNVVPKTIKLTLAWAGDWKNFKVREDR